jgi:FMN reductase
VTPIFTTSYSGLFKSFVDVLDTEALRGLPVLLAATGGSPRHSLAVDYAMRPLFSYLHAAPLSTTVFAASSTGSPRSASVSSTSTNDLKSPL